MLIEDCMLYNKVPSYPVVPTSAPAEPCHFSPASPSEATCEAPSAMFSAWQQLQRSKRQDYSVSELVHIRMRANQAQFLLEREKTMEREQAILEKEQEEKQAERVKLLESLETKSQLRMRKARVHLRRLLLTRRDGI